MSDDLKKDFGRVLLNARKNAGLSQEKLANMCDLERAYISRMERGLLQPTITTVFKIAKALNTTATDLIQKLEDEHNH